MFAQPTTGEGAPWHDGQVLGGGPLNRGSYQTSPYALSAELVGHLGVNQDEVSGLSPVDELGDLAGLFEDEAALSLNVADLRTRRVGHGRTVTSSARWLISAMAPSSQRTAV